MNAYKIIIHSNEHPRTINTWACQRTNYTAFECATKEDAIAKYLELVEQGKAPYQMYTPKCNSCTVRFDENGNPYIYIYPSRGIPFCR